MKFRNLRRFIIENQYLKQPTVYYYRYTINGLIYGADVECEADFTTIDYCISDHAVFSLAYNFNQPNTINIISRRAGIMKWAYYYSSGMFYDGDTCPFIIYRTRQLNTCHAKCSNRMFGNDHTLCQIILYHCDEHFTHIIEQCETHLTKLKYEKII